MDKQLKDASDEFIATRVLFQMVLWMSIPHQQFFFVVVASCFLLMLHKFKSVWFFDILLVLFCIGGVEVEPWCNWTCWRDQIQRLYESGDPQGLSWVKEMVKSLMFRKTKETKDKDGRLILESPPNVIQTILCEQSEAEKDFYMALFKTSKVQFNQFVAQGRVLHNYANILELLLRLR